jgi:hypothetical protein
MRNEHFDVTVTVGNAREDKARVVTDTVQAAESLLEDWPQDRRGPKYRAALRACMDVMEQRKGVASSLHRRGARGASACAKKRQRQQELALHASRPPSWSRLYAKTKSAAFKVPSSTSWSTSLSL